MTQGIRYLRDGDRADSNRPDGGTPQPQPDATPTRRFGRLQLEDIALLGWTALAWPVLRGVFPDAFSSDSMLDTGHPLRGLAWTLAIICAFVVIASHDALVPGEEPTTHIAPADGDPEARFAMFGPLVGGMGLIAAGGMAGLGLPRDLGFAAVFLGIPALVVISKLKVSPALPHATRRWLLAPFLLVAASVFNDFIHSIGLGPDLLRDAFGSASQAGTGLTDTLLSTAGILSLFVLAAALFYAMLIAVPRQLIESDGGFGTWLRRFACFVVGSLTGIGLLASFGY